MSRVTALFISSADGAELGLNRLLQRDQVFQPRDIGRDRQHVRVAQVRFRDDLGAGFVERLVVDVDHAELHAEAGKAPAGGAADAERRAGDDGDAACGEDGMGHGCLPIEWNGAALSVRQSRRARKTAQTWQSAWRSPG